MEAISHQRQLLSTSRSDSSHQLITDASLERQREAADDLAWRFQENMNLTSPSRRGTAIFLLSLEISSQKNMKLIKDFAVSYQSSRRCEVYFAIRVQSRPGVTRESNPQFLGAWRWTHIMLESSARCRLLSPTSGFVSQTMLEKVRVDIWSDGSSIS